MAITVSGGASVTYADPASHFSSTAGKWWIGIKPKQSEASKQNIASPGINGVAVGRNSDSYPFMEITVAYVGGSPSEDGGYMADIQAMQNHKLNVSYPMYGTLQNCELVDSEVIEDYKETGFGTCMLVAKITFEQKRGNAS